MPREVALARKSHRNRDLGHCLPCIPQQFAGALDPPFDHVLIRRDAGRRLERIAEMMRT
jgi:hypothetical protein